MPNFEINLELSAPSADERLTLIEALADHTTAGRSCCDHIINIYRISQVCSCDFISFSTRSLAACQYSYSLLLLVLSSPLLPISPPRLHYTYDAQTWVDQWGMDAQVNFWTVREWVLDCFQSSSAYIPTDPQSKPVCHLFYKMGMKKNLKKGPVIRSY